MKEVVELYGDLVEEAVGVGIIIGAVVFLVKAQIVSSVVSFVLNGMF